MIEKLIEEWEKHDIEWEDLKMKTGIPVARALCLDLEAPRKSLTGKNNHAGRHNPFEYDLTA